MRGVDTLSAKYVLLRRVTRMTGVEISGEVMESLKRNPSQFEKAEVFDYLDLLGLQENVKHMNVINQAKGDFYYLQGLIRHEDNAALQYFSKAEACLGECSVACSFGALTLVVFAQRMHCALRPTIRSCC